MALTKADIIEKLYNEMNGHGFDRNACSEKLEILLEIIKRTLESGEDVLISGFGKFCVKTKNERRGRNPSTGEDMMLAQRRVVTFKCSGKLPSREKIAEWINEGK